MKKNNIIKLLVFMIFVVVIIDILIVADVVRYDSFVDNQTLIKKRIICNNRVAKETQVREHEIIYTIYKDNTADLTFHNIFTSYTPEAYAEVLEAIYNLEDKGYTCNIKVPKSKVVCEISNKTKCNENLMESYKKSNYTCREE